MQLFILNGFIGEKLIPAIGWMLIHSLWLGMVFTIITGTGLFISRSASARARYNMVCIVFILFIASCITAFARELNSVQVNTGASPLFAENETPVKPGSFHSFFSGLVNFLTEHAAYIVLLWFIIVLFRAVKIVRSVKYIRRIAHHKTHAPGFLWQEKITSFCKTLNIKRTVLLLESELVKVPMVLGHLKPVILIPFGLLTQLPPAQLEAVLLHELAHIRRHDYFVNFLQSIAETVFFFNPGLLWISAILREEREHCCDDIALAQTNNKQQFIEALISFKEYSLYAPAGTMAFPGKNNQLMQRVTRILDKRTKVFHPAEKVFFLLSLLTLLFIAFVFFQGSTAKATEIKGITFQQLNQLPVENNQPFSERRVEPAYINKKALLQEDKARSKKVLIITEKKQAKENQESVKLINEKNLLAEKSEKHPAELTKQDNEEEKLNFHRQQAEKDREQAQRDRIQAEKDKQQAVVDRAQAEKDREQAQRDRIQADKDRKQADLDREQARRDRIQADKDMQEAMKARAEAIKYTLKK